MKTQQIQLRKEIYAGTISQLELKNELLYTCSFDGAIKIWKYPTLELVFEFLGRTDEMICFDIINRNQIIFTSVFYSFALLDIKSD